MDYLSILQMLLENGAKTDYRDDLGDAVLYPATTLSEEPLHLAIKNQHYNAARLLLGNNDANYDNARFTRFFFWKNIEKQLIRRRVTFSTEK